MSIFEVLSWIGTALFTTALVPQLIRTLKRRRADDLSILFLITVIAASACMMAWSLSIGAWVVSLGFVANIVVWGIVMWFRLNPGKPASMAAR